jgi:ribonuclease HII
MLGLGIERKYWRKGIGRIAGVDEAGRGPLAGPVVAAAVIFSPGVSILGVDDSKKLTPLRREELFEIIRQSALAFGVGIVSHETIDRINVLRATMEAMAEAVSRLKPGPDYLLVDGPICEPGVVPAEAMVRGDARCFSIAAASIIAKVTRDRIMMEYDRQFPGYGFARHKGYGTPEHLAALRRLGPCEIHRKSFRLTGGATEERSGG